MSLICGRDEGCASRCVNRRVEREYEEAVYILVIDCLLTERDVRRYESIVSPVYSNRKWMNEPTNEDRKRETSVHASY